MLGRYVLWLAFYMLKSNNPLFILLSLAHVARVFFFRVITCDSSLLSAYVHTPYGVDLDPLGGWDQYQQIDVGLLLLLLIFNIY